jgi:hypothetical protein
MHTANYGKMYHGQHHVMAIADAEDAVMNLRRLTLAHPLASWDAIRGMITRHYTRQLLQEVYKVGSPIWKWSLIV